MADNKVLIEYELTDKFVDKHIDSGTLSESYKRLGMEEKSFRVLNCGTDLYFRGSVDYSGAPKLYQANFCKDRLCPMCTWRRSKKIFGQVSRVMDEIEKDYAFIFLTLTIRNCSGDELSVIMNRLSEAFNLFRNYKQIKKCFKGYFKAIEITHNPSHPPSIQYHPHIHLIIAVNKSYFRSKYYLSHSDFQELWQRAMRLDYYPVVYVEKVKNLNLDNDGNVSIKGAVAEVAKYSIKSADLLYGSDAEIDERVYIFLSALNHRRLCSFGGIFKKIAAELLLDDLLDGDLVNTDNENLRSDVASLIYNYRWVAGVGYQLNLVYLDEKDVTVIHK